MTTDTEALVRRAYHLAEGDVLDVQRFIDLFTEDGVFNGIGGVCLARRATGVSNWAMCSSGWANSFPTFNAQTIPPKERAHRERRLGATRGRTR